MSPKLRNRKSFFLMHEPAQKCEKCFLCESILLRYQLFFRWHILNVGRM